MKKLTLLSILSVFLFVNSAQAGFLIDPYLGIGQHTTVLDAVTSGGDVADDTNNLSATGARIGYSFLLLSAGLDYSITKVDGTDITNMSIFAGVDLPILIRGWVEYFISSKGDSEFNDAYKFTDGYGIGLGFTGLPFVSINLEIQNINYEAELAGAQAYDNATAATILSISLPLDF